MIKTNIQNLRTAIVYDRINKFGGAERVLLVLHEMFPEAPLYTSVYDKQKAGWADVFPKIYTSFIQKMPFLKHKHELLGWLMPIAFENFDFKEYDLVISVTSEAAKGIITGTNTLHVCYCLTPTRYLWSGYDFYLNNPPKIFKIFPFYKLISKPFLNYAKFWDKIASNRPDIMIAISSEVQTRIKKYYNIDSDVIFPPVNSPRATSQSSEKKYFLIHGRFEPYKRLDLVIDTFSDLGLPLVVSGSGSEYLRLKESAKQNIKFIDSPSDEDLSELYSNAIAFIMPQEEDFGITSVEAQSYGVPVISYAKGGSLDTVVDGTTGIMFNDQTKASLINAIKRFDMTSFNKSYLVTNSKRFANDRFKKEFFEVISGNINK